jgi:hypothetical protein
MTRLHSLSKIISVPFGSVSMFAGINRYDTGTKKITHYEHSFGYPDSSSWNAFQSRDGETMDQHPG